MSHPMYGPCLYVIPTAAATLHTAGNFLLSTVVWVFEAALLVLPCTLPALHALAIVIALDNLRIQHV